MLGEYPQDKQLEAEVHVRQGYSHGIHSAYTTLHLTSAYSSSVRFSHPSGKKVPSFSGWCKYNPDIDD